MALEEVVGRYRSLEVEVVEVDLELRRLIVYGFGLTALRGERPQGRCHSCSKSRPMDNVALRRC